MANDFKAAEKAFEKAVADAAVEEQLAAGIVAGNIMHGAFWGFCGKIPVLEEHIKEFRESHTCDILEITGNPETGEMGYLVSIKMEKILELLCDGKGELLTEQDAAYCRQRHEEAITALVKRIASGYSGKIGVFYTGDSQTITIDGKTFPAYPITFKELCMICDRIGFGIVSAGEVIDARRALAQEDTVVKGLELAPCGDALFVEIARMTG